MAADGNEVELGAEEEQMAPTTASALDSFELVEDMLRLVFEVAVIFMVFWVLPQFVEQLLVADFVHHRVTD